MPPRRRQTSNLQEEGRHMLDRLMRDCWLRGIRLSASEGRLMIAAATPQALNADLEQELLARSGEILSWLELHADYFAARPLSDNEQALWFLQRMEPNSCAYNIALAGRVRPQYLWADLPQRLERAWQVVQQRYPHLCSAYVERDGELLQWDSRPQPTSLQCEALQGADAASIQRRVIELADTPFDLAAGEVSRLVLLSNELGDRVEHTVLLGIHHIASDLTTFDVLFSELFAQVDEQALADVAPQAYRNWCCDLYVRSEAIETEELAWWQTQLADVPTLELPTDFAYGSSQGFDGGELSFHFGADDSERLRAVARRLGVTPYVYWFSLFQQFLGVLSGQDDFVLGTPSGWRLKREQAELPGYLVNPLPVRCRLRRDLSSAEWAKQVAATVRQTLRHRHYPFARLAKHLDLPRQMGRAPVFQHMFTLNKERDVPFERYIERMIGEQRGAAHELNLVIIDDLPEFIGRWRYSKALYRRESVERFQAQFLALVMAAMEQPDVPFSELNWLAPEQRSQLSGEVLPVLEESAWQAFTKHCSAKPQAIALEDRQGQLSYAELAGAVVARGERLQGSLSALGDRIALCLPRSRELVMHMLAAWQCGATYLALDPQWPESRLQGICLDATPRVCVGMGERPHWLPTSVQWLVVPSAPLFSDAPLRAGLPADLPAYVVYTSGSSGRPKGVEVTQGNLIHYVSACLERLQLSYEASLTSLASCATDLGHTALFGALLSGRRLRLLDEALAFDAEELAALLGQQPVDMLKIVPSHLNALLVASEPQRLLPRQCLVLGGEALGADLLARVRALSPSLRIVNHYGPSETTVGVLTHEVEGEGDAPLGRPLGNVRISVRGPDGAVLPAGVSGELYIEGATVARGYLSASEVDQARFGKLGYRTGDRVRLDHLGRVLFLGRLDEQVKIRGYRVEPSEVAAQLRALPQVEDVRVLNAPTPLTGNRLVAFLVAAPSALAGIQAALQARLPDYMQPAQWHCLEAMPLLANGKVDRLALLTLTEQAPRSIEARAEQPLNEVERALLAIWRELLGNPSIGPDDNFFAHGGDSILGLQIIARARQQRITLTPKQLFAEPSVRALARVAQTPQRARVERLLTIAREILEKPDLQADDNFFAVGGDSILSLQIIARAKQQGLQLKPKQIFEFPSVSGWAEQAVDLASVAEQTKVDSAEPSGAFALTPIQAWFFGQQQSTPQYWNQSLLLAVHEPLEPVRLAQALATLLQRHSSLRLVFERGVQGWQQRYQLLPADMAGKLLQVVEQPLDDVLLEQWQQGWQLDRAPLIRWVYFTGSGHLLCTAHHLLVDAVSWQVLLEELESLYLDPQAALPVVSASFHRWSEALQRHRQEPAVLAQREYWQAQLAEEGEVTRVVSLYGESRTLETRLSAEKTEQLLGDCHEAYSTQVQDLLVAALASVIGQWLGREQVTLEMESHGRSGWEQGPDLSRSVGWHTSRYPLAVPAAEQPEEAIIAAKETLRRVPEQGIGYGLLRLDPQQLGAASLLTFNYLGRVDQWLGGSRLWRLAQPLCPAMRAPDTCRTHLLDVTALVDQGQLHIEWRYAPQVHEQALIGALAQQFQQRIEALLEHCLDPEAGRATAADFADSGLSDDEFLGLLEQLQ
jgi:amino acid adenylation domain-containing protein/non-ribosomal peptide synthase protein (TIGR01720 family)